MLKLIFESLIGLKTELSVPRCRLAIAGWTGRDVKSVMKHIDELTALGVAPPPHTPLIYEVAASLLTTDNCIDVIGKKTSGEAEFVLFAHQGENWVGIGSDHTCRHIEILDVATSKQVCAKPIGKTVWRLRDIRAHWDALELRSYTIDQGVRACYQHSALEHIRQPEALFALCDQEGIARDSCFLFGGTVPLVGSWCAADHFVCELHDPILGRSIHCAYTINAL